MIFSPQFLSVNENETGQMSEQFDSFNAVVFIDLNASMQPYIMLLIMLFK